MSDVWVPCVLRPSPRPRVTRNGTFMPRWYTSQAAELARTLAVKVPALPAVETVVDLAVVLPRKPSHLLRNGGLARSAPRWPPARAGDVDNLAKSVLDAAVKGGVLPDDSQIVRLSVSKRYAEAHETPGFAVRFKAVGANTAELAGLHVERAGPGRTKTRS